MTADGATTDLAHVTRIEPEQITALRLQRGWSVKKMASIAGVSARAISRWESGEAACSVAHWTLLSLGDTQTQHTTGIYRGAVQAWSRGQVRSAIDYVLESVPEDGDAARALHDVWLILDAATNINAK